MLIIVTVLTIDENQEPTGNGQETMTYFLNKFYLHT